MKFIHLSDLHLGKRVNEYSMLEDQEYILDKIIGIVDSERPDALLIAGDIYDKALAPAEAVQLFDDFLVKLSHRGVEVMAISGNHDSPERIAFGGRLMSPSGVHFSPVYDGSISVVTLSDAVGEVNFYLLPFLKPANVRRFYPDAEISSYTDALRIALEQAEPDTSARNVLVTHQFVTGAERSESEELSVGGSDNVDASVFDGFDYVALGHIHRGQNIGSERIRYCGTPLKYSFSEASQEKSATVVELGAKGELNVRALPLKPMRDMVELRGSYDELTLRENYADTSYPEDYVRITLTDEEDVPEAAAKLRTIYHNLMRLDYDNLRTRGAAQLDEAASEGRSPLGLFEDLYEAQNNQPMSDSQRELIQKLLESIGGN